MPNSAIFAKEWLQMAEAHKFQNFVKIDIFGCLCPPPAAGPRLADYSSGRSSTVNTDQAEIVHGRVYHHHHHPNPWRGGGHDHPAGVAATTRCLVCPFVSRLALWVDLSWNLGNGQIMDKRRVDYSLEVIQDIYSRFFVLFIEYRRCCNWLMWKEKVKVKVRKPVELQCMQI